MRVPLHEHFHVPVTSYQRAEVKRVLHCDATASVDMDALLSETLPAVAIFSPQQLQIYTYFDLISLQSLLYNASLSSPKNRNVSQFSSFESSGNAIGLLRRDSSSMRSRPAVFGME